MKEELIEKGLIPISKYWSIRFCFLDIINRTQLFIPLIEDREDMGDDVKTAIKISKVWDEKNDIRVGEAGFLFRLLQFASWKYGLHKDFIKEKTLLPRKICDNPSIVNWPISKLLTLDNHTTQWASAAILTGNTEATGPNFFLDLTRECLMEYNHAKTSGKSCKIRCDDTILSQALAYIEMKKGGATDFKPQQPDDYCFARAFNLITKAEGEGRWPELRGHESDRLEEMEDQLNKLDTGLIIDSRDHRVVQAIIMLSKIKKREVSVKYPEAVNKSWPQFWDFISESEMLK